MKKDSITIILDIKVSPGSKKSLLSVDKNGHLKAYISSQPERGLANDELIQLLSKTLKIPKFSIEIIQGLSSRHKRVKIISHLLRQQINQLLGFAEENQLSMFE